MEKAGNAPKLSARQIEVLRLVEKGFSNTDIAAMLGIGPNGVKDHLTRAYVALGADSRTKAVALARSFGII